MSENKTALVTGASSGIGLELTKTLLARGYQVVANSRTLTSAGTLTASDRLALVDFASMRLRQATLIPPLHKNNDHGFLSNMHPIARMGQASEIVDAIMYLHAAPFVTGEVISVDGGAHAGKW
jgi:NAD(P)-dependent dehydrogenase (short-subunit alcohol dehydrogenase family)